MRRPAVLALAVLLSACTATQPQPPRPARSSPHSLTPHSLTSHSRSVAPPALHPLTSLGAWGVQATWVQRENERPGSRAWRIPAGTSDAIHGYADTTYAAVGQQVRLYVSTPAPTFRVWAFRMGYYGGDDACLVWRSPAWPAGTQPACSRRPGVNLVTCDRWRPSATITLTRAFVPGDYLFELVGSGGQRSYVPLTVWDPGSRAAYVVKNDALTWQAWNVYGGYDFYTGRGRCPPAVYPLCSRARIVSFDRPYAGEHGAASFLKLELPLVEFVERHALDLTYATDLTLVEHPGYLLAHKALLSLGHDECWALPERRAAVRAERRGLNIVFFGASAMLRHVRMQASPRGADREVVDYRDSAADPLDGRGDPLQVTGNTWGSPPASWPENEFVGAMYAGFLEPNDPPVPFVVADAAAWIFTGTGLRTGQRVPGVVAYDVDGFDPSSHPADLQIFGHSPVPVAESQAHIVNWGPVFYSDMTYYTDPASRAGVFDSGTNNWITALLPCPAAQHACPSDVVARITGNLLRVFGQRPAGRIEPARANWSAIAPY